MGRDQARSGLLIVNALGGLEDPNLKDSDGSVLEPRVLRDAHDSGLTAVNVTLGYVSGDADPFEQSVRDIAQMDGWMRAGGRDLLKIYTADDILRARSEGRIGIIYGFQNAAMLGSDVTRVDLFAKPRRARHSAHLQSGQCARRRLDGAREPRPHALRP